MFSDDLLNTLWNASYILFAPIAVIVAIVLLIFCGLITFGRTTEDVTCRRYRKEWKLFLWTLKYEERLTNGKDPDTESTLSQEETDDTEEDEDLHKKET